jgi:hypothetical protein
MAYKFNPLIGIGLDDVGEGGAGGGTPGGSDTQVQFNDGDSFGADSGLTFNKTTNALTVGASTVDGGSAKIYGDINLDDGGSFSTTVQAVTPTANRTISFPDATGTVALVNGANGTIQYNDAGTLKGNSDFTVDPDWNDASTVFTGLKLNVTDGAGGSPVGDSDSSLLDLQVNGTSAIRISGATGIIDFRDGVGKLLAPDGSSLAFLFGSVYSVGFANNRLGVSASSSIGWTSGNFGYAGQDLSLFRDAADTLAQRRGTNAQTYRLYNTWANNGVDFERTSLTRDSSGLVIDAQKGGTGADPTNLLDVKLGGASCLSVTATALVTKAGYYIGNILLFGSGSANLTVDAGTVRTGTNIPLGIGGNDVFLARETAGVVKVTDGSTGTGYLKLIPTTVNALTPAGTVGAGARAFVTDSNSTLSSHHGQPVTAGGTNFVPVFSDGTSWIVG